MLLNGRAFLGLGLFGDGSATMPGIGFLSGGGIYKSAGAMNFVNAAGFNFGTAASPTQFAFANTGTLTVSGSLFTGGQVRAGAGSEIYWTGRSMLTAPSDGVIRLTNQAASDFARLQLGGTSSAFPSIKRNGNAIHLRLADDSGYCDITAASLIGTTGTITNNAVTWRSGSGTPEGAITAPVGSLFSRTDGGALTSFYVKESGAGNVGWVAK